LKAFEFHQPTTLEEASRLLVDLGDGAMVYAGGTDIIPRTKLKKLAPDHLVNIKGIDALKEIDFDGEILKLGALVRFNDIIFSDVIKEHFPILAEVARSVASHQVRNLATVGGNICNAAPSADSVPILIALGAKVNIYTAQGETDMPLEEFFKGPGEVELQRGDILTNIILKKPTESTGFAYQKHKIRKTLEIAIVGVAVALEMDGENCKDARIVVGAAAPTPIRCPKAEELLKGTTLGVKEVRNAGKAAAKEVSPIDDVRGTAEYRREMTRICLKRAVRDAKKGVAQ
jgi:carbon-monoxide dehydrogenase medium subunit